MTYHIKAFPGIRFALQGRLVLSNAQPLEQSRNLCMSDRRCEIGQPVRTLPLRSVTFQGRVGSTWLKRALSELGYVSRTYLRLTKLIPDCLI